MTAPMRSPLPWHVAPGSLYIHDANDELVEDGFLAHNGEANARLIVAAVNSHAELLAAAKELALACAAARPDIAHLLGPAEIAAYDRARDAIANAEKDAP